MKIVVTGPCRFLVIYDIGKTGTSRLEVTEPCKFLVIYDQSALFVIVPELQDPVDF